MFPYLKQTVRVPSKGVYIKDKFFFVTKPTVICLINTDPEYIVILIYFFIVSNLIPRFSTNNGHFTFVSSEKACIEVANLCPINGYMCKLSKNDH